MWNQISKYGTGLRLFRIFNPGTFPMIFPSSNGPRNFEFFQKKGYIYFEKYLFHKNQSYLQSFICTNTSPTLSQSLVIWCSRDFRAKRMSSDPSPMGHRNLMRSQSHWQSLMSMRSSHDFSIENTKDLIRKFIRTNFDNIKE